MRTVEAIAAGTFEIIDMTGLRLRSMKICDNVCQLLERKIGSVNTYSRNEVHQKSRKTVDE